jgi:mono/diheme cytochrome c family protein
VALHLPRLPSSPTDLTPMKYRRLFSLLTVTIVALAGLRPAMSIDDNAASDSKPAAASRDDKAHDDGIAKVQDKKLTGKQIYQTLCAACHGANGQGVAEKHDEPLYGDKSLPELVKVIDATMPEGAPEKCTGEDAKKVAAFVYETFYTADARTRNTPPRVELSRLTVGQYQQSVADLLGTFRNYPSLDDRRGLPGSYYSSRNFVRDKKAFDRDDAQIEFDFADKSPDEKIPPEEFSVRWEGSLIVEDSGDYEFGVKTQNGFRLWINDADKPAIDGWVSSGAEPREQTVTLRLLGGRAYPLKLDFFKYKDKSASINLRWRPPQKSWETIPARHLSPLRTPETLVVATPFPPDDSSTGYPRGTAVSKDWDKATTDAAIETANYVVEHLDDLLGMPRRDRRRNVGEGDGRKGKRRESVEIGSDEYRKRTAELCTRLAERAFRRPLSDEEKQFFVDSRFGDADDVVTAVKRAVILTLKSPRFLYPEIATAGQPQYATASRLAMALWDSLPDQELLSAAADGRLKEPDQISQQAERLLQSPLAKAKVRDFFHNWLPYDEAEDLLKDPEAYPGFNDQLLADLRTSLDMFIDEVVWSEASDYRQLVLADYWFVNDRLASFYSLPSPAESGFHKVAVDANQRAGILTHPYLLAALAYHKSSSPIHRGVFVMRKLLGRALRPPPQAIQFMDGSFDPHMTMREKVTELTKSETCQACHSMINPLGFSLEHFDAVGRFRTTEKEKPIDSKGAYTTASGEQIQISGARDLAEHAAASEEAHRGFVDQMFQHVVKQPAAAYGGTTADRLVKSFADSGYSIHKLLIEITSIAASPPQ